MSAITESRVEYDKTQPSLPGRYGFYDGFQLYNDGLKRGIDCALAVTAIPAVILVALALLIVNPFANPGSLFFCQRRVGRCGKPFVMLKFRSMVGCSTGTKFVGEEIDRVSPLGRWLRRFRIDELPQFFNIIRGDMSFIGPRPEQEEFVSWFSKEIPEYDLRHRVRPGITGLAQVRCGYADDIVSTRRKLENDLEYIGNVNLIMDCKIVVRTVIVVLSGFGVQ